MKPTAKHICEVVVESGKPPGQYAVARMRDVRLTRRLMIVSELRTLDLTLRMLASWS